MRVHQALTLILLTGALLGGCSTGTPDGAEPVTDFQLERYLGQWYEIARFDHSFEEGLQCVTADYSLRSDGGVRVINRGYHPGKDEVSEAEGRAYFMDEESVGWLKVSFFGPFFGGYNVLALDEAYQHALVSGPERDYLWILSRWRVPDAAVVSLMLDTARSLAFPVEALLWVEQGSGCGPYYP